MGRLIAYICDRCKKFVNVELRQSCNCEDVKLSNPYCLTEFKPFYSDECKTMITSSRQMDRVYKQHGLRPLGDAPFLKKYQNIKRHKLEYLESRHKEMGNKFNPDVESRYSDHQKKLIPKNDWMNEKARGL